jgi:hypothetical protein
VRYRCCDERRLEAVKEAGALNGIEYLEVSDSEAPSDDLRQRTLFVRLFEAPANLGKANVVIEGGERIPVAVEWAVPATPLPAGEDPDLTSGLNDPSTVLLVRTDSRGDFSTYTLRLVAGKGSEEPPANFDPLLASVEFSFKVECPSEFDCAPLCDCPPDIGDGPAIDYLAKDYRGFRSLMLDRLSLLAPEWKERNTPDVGIALVELLAYVADELSYRQDAVATEAYLKTARRRTSLRRHAKLVDYVVQEGANARVWVRVLVDGEGVALAPGTPLLTRVAGIDPVLDPDSEAYLDALAAGAETFETVDRVVLYASHERLDFWTWGDLGCCLPRGATSATLVGDHPHLKAGDVLVLAEVADPRTGRAEDADPAKRTAVRLTHVFPSSDPSGGLFTENPNDVEVPVTEIEWDDADALRFPLCISVEDRPDLVVGEAWGNIVLADHGRTISEPLGTVPQPVLSRVPDDCDPCERTSPEPIPIRFRPTLARRPITHTRPAPTQEIAEGPLEPPALATQLDTLTFGPELHDWLEDRGLVFSAGPAVVRGGNDVWSVSDGVTVALIRATAGPLELFARPTAAGPTLSADPRKARPAVALDGTLLGVTERWLPQLDLLESGGDAAEFVVEVEHDGAATLRFGDGVHGRRPDADTSFQATYRVGNGIASNVGKGAIAHVVKAGGGGVTGVVNPLPAVGGVEPEPAEAIRRDAPEAYLIQQRAVTEEDYASVSERNPRIQQAAATFRWTGSWHTVFVTADAVVGHAVDEELETDLRGHLEPFRMAGYDLEVDAPRFVPLDVELHLCVEPEYFRAHVKEAVLDVLSSGVRADGTLGFFHPDRFTFGKSVYLSAIVAAVQRVRGVQSVVPQAFQRQHDDASSAVETGILTMNRLEIGRLDNDPTFPDRGVLVVTAGGGK